MRISSNTIFESNVTLLGQQQARLLQTQQQIASGRRILTAADDPVAAARALEITQSDAMNTQYAANRTAARHKLSMAESSLQSVTSLLHDVRTAVVGAGNGSLNNSDRSTIATGLSGRLQELIGLANSTDGTGNYLFSGFQTKTQPFSDTGAGIGYFGDGGQQNMQVSAIRQIASGNSGADIFMRVKNGNGTFVTQATTTNTGTGTIGLGTVSNPAALTGNSYTIAFDAWSAQAAAGNGGTGAISTPSVVTPASVTGDNYTIELATWVTQEVGGNSGSGVISTASVVGPVTGDSYTVTIDPGGTTYTVDDLTTGFPVAGMTNQPFVSGQAIVFDGLQFNIQGTPNAGDVFNVTPPVSGTYTVTNDTTGLPVAGMMAQVFTSGQAISFDGLSMNIQGAPNDGDIFNVAPPVSGTYTVTNNATGLPVTGAMAQTFTSGQAISFDGMRIDIQGTPNAGDSFTITPSTNESIFKTISDLITVLNTPISAATVNGATQLSNSLGVGLNNLDNALNNVLNVRSSLGLRLNEIDALQATGEDLSLQFKQNLSELQDVDYNKAISDLTLQQMSLQAAQKSFIQITDMSLFSYL